MEKSILTKRLHIFISSCIRLFTGKARQNLSLSRVTAPISQLLTLWYPQWDSPRSKVWWRATGRRKSKSPLGPFHTQDYIDQNTAWRKSHQMTAGTVQHRAKYSQVHLGKTVKTQTYVRKEIKIRVNSHNFCCHLVLNLSPALLLVRFLLHLLKLLLHFF
jgi:hypothetical protein